ncbi:hypothetical protein ASC63_13555 [Leifsonia sp. Root112D2]|nr:hypothetical protein ASC63_13555 [Leifsonia sp. Root112D2]
MCQSCGKPGSEIDHISGSSDEPTNLQLLCNECHRAKTMKNMIPAPDEEKALIAALFIERIVPDVPVLLADDEAEWQRAWSALKKERRQRLRDEIESMGINLAGLKTRAEWIVKRDAVLSERAQGQPAPSESLSASDGFNWDIGKDTFLEHLLNRSTR